MDGDPKYTVYDDDVEQKIKYEVTNVKSRPSTTSLSHININFKFEIKNSSQTYGKIIHESVSVAIDLSQRESLTAELRLAVQSILTYLPMSRNGDVGIVGWASGKAFNLFVERWGRSGKVPLNLELDMLVRIEESYAYDDDNDDEVGCCCICLEEMKLDEELSSMPCGHVFHGNCIKGWLNTGHNCPVCRFQPTTT